MTAAADMLAIRVMIQEARERTTRLCTPRDDTERAIVNAVGEISPDEAVAAIERHRAGLPGHLTEPNV